MSNSNDKHADRLVISFKFPPENDISGIVVFKRIINDKKLVDLLHNKLDDNIYSNFEVINQFINDRLNTTVDAKRDSSDCIFNFTRQGLDLIKNKEYKEIYSRSWYMSNHFLALEYKFKHPNTQWIAEFSDLVLRDTNGRIRKHNIMNNIKYIEKINSRIQEFNKIHSTNIDKFENPANTFQLAELLTMLFADKIIFTNHNQRQIMLESYDEKIKEFINNKSEIIHHPTLDDSYYHLTNEKFNLNEDDINIAYFGGSYYALRHFEALYYAFESLNHKFKYKIKFHLFINTDQFMDFLVNDLDFKNNIIIREPLDYFKFLNATLRFDILLINDSITEEYFTVNPYLPSKLSDYLGSNCDIWAIYEENSTLSKMDLKYKSMTNNYVQSRDVLVNILEDYGYGDNDYSYDNHFYEKRINQFNKMITRQHKLKNRYKLKSSNLNKKVKILTKNNKNLDNENKKLFEQINKVNNENKKIINQNKKLNEKYNAVITSRSWKITKPIRKITMFFRKHL